MRVTYPVIFTDVDTNILIEVPDLQILTEANDEKSGKGTIADPIMMARDAIGLDCIAAEDEGREIVPPSAIHMIDPSKGSFTDIGESFISLVDVDLTEYRRRTDNKAVRRNVTLPSWLNYEAEHAGINVSRVLQEALMNVLNVQRVPLASGNNAKGND
ncbi:MAG: type II toxin-antitoxin system HicB family antitoxin [Lachnospiraceae bacterium]|nr:type II toxin-antitoxin system HicB family antitoxin [Lachnospiraceae bacterium]